MSIATEIHLFPSRTEKLSTRTPTIVISENRKLLVFKAKDYSGDSFPGDHGLMLMIYAGFMLRYFGKKAFAVSCIILIIFMLPRIMAGAHWFTDIAVGSLSISLVGLSWVLLTPVSDKCIDFLNKIFPDKAVK